MKSLLLLFLLPTLCFAEPQDIRISDFDGHVVDITAGGEITITSDTPTAFTTPHTREAPEMRVTDNDGDILNVNSDGSINLS